MWPFRAGLPGGLCGLSVLSSAVQGGGGRTTGLLKQVCCVVGRLRGPLACAGRRLAAAAAAGCSGWRVGCCVGADQLAVSALVGAGQAQRVRVFAAFGPGGAGACSLSAVSSVSAAAAAGASVSWWAGGGAAVPLRGRLAARSAACVRGASALLLFSPGAGSLAVAGAAAVAAGVPVWAVAPAAPAPVPGFSGAWVRGSFLGFAAWCWVASGAGAQLSLF